MRINGLAFPRTDVFDRLFFSPFTFEPAAEWPELVVEDKGEAYALTADLPGVLAKDLEIVAQGNELVVKGSRKLSVPEGYGVRRQERVEYRFNRKIALPVRIDSEGVAASLENGVLTLTIPKAKDARPRKIAIGMSTSAIPRGGDK